MVSAKTKCNTSLDNRRLKPFDVLKNNGGEKLIVPLKPGETNVEYYATNDELCQMKLAPDQATEEEHLRPLKTKRSEEVAYHVLSIFLTFGVPAILQSDNGREFINQIIPEKCAMWKDVHGNSRYSQTQGSAQKANQDIQNMLTAWMNDNDTNKWSEELPFVEFTKNTTYH
ncbi:SCAN domain-containing protein 3 [Trichonephila clavipes]|nr:SCAN domain-containing protein 3 [Trichonephila clavipes]